MTGVDDSVVLNSEFVLELDDIVPIVRPVLSERLIVVDGGMVVVVDALEELL